MASAQSLAELAKKEKERRKKNKGEESKVITESDLSRVKSPTFSSTAVPSSGSPRSDSSRAEGIGPEGSSPEESEVAEAESEGVDVTAPSTIPSDAPLQDKIALFEQMVKAHRAEIQVIDDQIAKNNARIAEIDQELTSVGGTGLPTAPQADRAPRYEGQVLALRTEQQELRQKNSQLEAQKTSKTNALRERGRRAGIPAGYLRF
jgi:hypothetical protein